MLDIKSGVAYTSICVTAGVKAKDISVSLEKGSLSIDAKGSGYSYSYLLPLPSNQIDETVNPEAVSEDGILKITLQKMKTSRPLKITVKSSS